MKQLIKKLVRAALAESFVPEEIAEARLEVCKTCPKLKVDKCLVCGCFVDLKAYMDYNKNPKEKLRVEKTHCPLGKWQGFDEVTGGIYENDKEIANFYRKLDGITLLK